MISTDLQLFWTSLMKFMETSHFVEQLRVS